MAAADADAGVTAADAPAGAVANDGNYAETIPARVVHAAAAGSTDAPEAIHMSAPPCKRPRMNVVAASADSTTGNPTSTAPAGLTTGDPSATAASAPVPAASSSPTCADIPRRMSVAAASADSTTGDPTSTAPADSTTGDPTATAASEPVPAPSSCPTCADLRRQLNICMQALDSALAACDAAVARQRRLVEQLRQPPRHPSASTGNSASPPTRAVASESPVPPHFAAERAVIGGSAPGHIGTMPDQST